MTNVVKGAGAARHRAARKHQQKDVVVGGARTDALKEAAIKSTPRKAGKTQALKETAATAGGEASMHAKVLAFQETAIGLGWSVAYNEDEAGQHLTCTRDKETLTIFWLNGVYQRWAEHTFDGGAPQRVPNAKSGLRVLEAKPEQAAAAATKKKAAVRRQPGSKPARSTAVGDDGKVLTKAERIQIAMAGRPDIDWESMSDDEVLAFVNGKKLTWINTMTGNTTQARLVRDSNKTKIIHGSYGRGVTFVTTDGPFMSVALAHITAV